MNGINVRAPIPLPPAVVAVAYADGLLKTADLNAPIAAQVKMWEAAEPGYYFQLMVNGELVGDEREFTAADKPGDVITVYLSEKLLAQEGNYRLSYMASSRVADAHTPSPEITLRVDRTPPGAALLAPMIFPNPTSGDRLTALLPGYAGMEAGDIIQTRCNGATGPTHSVQPDELTIRPIEILFAREQLQGFGTQNLVIDYSVTDRAGNQSVMSLPVTLPLTL